MYILSHLKMASNPHQVGDTQIADLVGLRTYTMLWEKFPYLYDRLVECETKYIQSAKNEGFFSTQTSFMTLFIDTDYTPENLKDDLKLLYIGAEPRNPEAKNLVNSSTRTTSYMQTSLNNFGIIICIIIFWSVVAMIFIYIIRRTKFYNNFTTVTPIQ